MKKKKDTATYIPPPYIIGEPGGINGPFWSIVNDRGIVVAMAISTKENAMLFRAAPYLHDSAQEALAYMRHLPGCMWDSDFNQCDCYVQEVIHNVEAAIALVKEK